MKNLTPVENLLLMNKNIFFSVDWFAVLFYTFLVGFGMMNLYSATYEENLNYGNFFLTPIGKQTIFLVLSIVSGILILAVDPKILEPFSNLVYFFCIILLIGLFLLGKTVNFSTSWYSIGPFSFQPSEFAKIGTTLVLGNYLSNIQTDIKNFSSQIKIISLLFLPIFLISLQPDLGSALIFVAFFFPLFREGLSYIYLVTFFSASLLFLISISFESMTTIAIIILLFFLLFFILKKFYSKIKIWPFIIFAIVSIGFSFSVDYMYNELFEQRHRDRIEILLGKKIDSRGAGYNINQSKIAIGSGGISGKGFLEGTQTKGNFVPEQHTDYIFSTIGEEWGFLGSSFLIIIYLALIIRIIISAEKQAKKFRRFFSYSVASLIFVHFLINIGMSLGISPTIGIPLPFISYGGSCLLAFSILIFIHLNLDANRLNE